MLVPELCILLCILVDAHSISLLYQMINALEPHLKIFTSNLYNHHRLSVKDLPACEIFVVLVVNLPFFYEIMIWLAFLCG